MKERNPVYKIILSTIGLVILAIVMTIYIILPSTNYIKNIKNDIQQSEKNSTEQLDKIKKLKKSIAELDTVQKNIKPLEESMVDKNDTLELIKKFEDLASSQNIEQTTQITLEKEDSLTFSFKTKASFYKTLQYLNSLEHLPFYIQINNLSWSRIDDINVSLGFQVIIFLK